MRKLITFDAVVLAGGRSSRMGVNKARLQMDGESLLARAQRMLALTGANDIWVSDNHQPVTHHRILRDIIPHSGPLGGMYTALMQSKRPLLVIPVDMPNLDDVILSCLIQKSLENSSDAVHFVTTPLPLLLTNTDKAKRILQRTLTCPGSDKSIRHLLKQLSVTTLAADEPDKLINVNTPADWLRYTLSHSKSRNYEKVNYDLGNKSICSS